MKIGVVAESTMEREALSSNLAPTPLLETQVAFTTARAIMAAAELGIFEALGTGEKTAEEVTVSCRTDPKATLQLLNCLVGIGYARWQDRKYGMIDAHRKWLLRKSPSSIVDKLAFQALEWDLVGKLEDFVRTGTPLDFHGRMSAEQWRIYQDGMRDVSAGPAVELAQQLAIPPDATRLLDIGGSHGLYSIELCRRYPALNATILELPGAVDRASEIAAREGMGERVKHRLGNALTEDLGEGTFDVVIINNLVHHFTPEQNGELARRVARGLVRGGVYAIGDFLRAGAPGAGGGMPAVMDLYFALTSASGTWSADEMAFWQRDAGLVPREPILLQSIPGWASLPAERPK
jgi:SAM-dependent methyltransferase